MKKLLSFLPKRTARLCQRGHASSGGHLTPPSPLPLLWGLCATSQASSPVSLNVDQPVELGFCPCLVFTHLPRYSRELRTREFRTHSPPWSWDHLQGVKSLLTSDTKKQNKTEQNFRMKEERSELKGEKPMCWDKMAQTRLSLPPPLNTVSTLGRSPQQIRTLKGREKMDWQRPQDLRKDRAGRLLDAVFRFLGAFIFFLEWVLERPATQNRELIEKNEQITKPGKPLSVQELGKGQHSRNLMPTRVVASARPPPSHRVSGRVRRTQPGSPKLPPNPQGQGQQGPVETYPPYPGQQWPHLPAPVPQTGPSTQWQKATQVWCPLTSDPMAALTGFLELQCHQENEADHNNI